MEATQQHIELMRFQLARPLLVMKTDNGIIGM